MEAFRESEIDFMSDPVVEVKHLAKSYHARGQTIEVLKDLGFTIQKGEIVALLGDNGAGKSTLIKCLSRVITKDKGDIIFADLQADQTSLTSTLFEGNRNFYMRLTVRENLMYFGIFKGLSKSYLNSNIDSILSELDILEKRDALMKDLSRGMQQKVGLANCLLGRPLLIILDEPTLGLDIASRIYLKDKIMELAEKGNTFLVSSHELGFVDAIATKVLFLQNGKTEDISTERLDSIEGVKFKVRLMEPITTSEWEILKAHISDLSDLKNSNKEALEIPAKDLSKLIELLKSERIISVERTNYTLEDIFTKKSKKALAAA
jgi:ABC-2 type transport system ATP-binding protein